MSFGPDGNLYVAQAYKKASVILKFSGTPSKGSSTLKYIGEFVTPSASAGLSHPYQPVFSADGDLFVSSQCFSFGDDRPLGHCCSAGKQHILYEQTAILEM